MSMTITYLDIRSKIECKNCKGSGEFVNEEAMATGGQLFFYVCPKCKGKGYTMKRRRISLEQFKELKN